MEFHKVKDVVKKKTKAVENHFAASDSSQSRVSISWARVLCIFCEDER